MSKIEVLKVETKIVFREVSILFFDIENLNERMVSRVIFIGSRFGRRDVANLIAGGPYGHIYFWNIYKNGVLMAKFRPVNI